MNEVELMTRRRPRLSASQPEFEAVINKFTPGTARRVRIVSFDINLYGPKGTGMPTVELRVWVYNGWSASTRFDWFRWTWKPLNEAARRFPDVVRAAQRLAGPPAPLMGLPSHVLCDEVHWFEAQP